MNTKHSKSPSLVQWDYRPNPKKNAAIFLGEKNSTMWMDGCVLFGYQHNNYNCNCVAATDD